MSFKSEKDAEKDPYCTADSSWTPERETFLASGGQTNGKKESERGCVVFAQQLDGPFRKVSPDCSGADTW